MLDRPRLCVIIPCLNVADTLAGQLEALGRQECSEPWEVIIADNGSRDATQAVAARYRTSLPSLRTVRVELKGRQHACNRGARASSGEFLVFIDGDDEVAPGFLQAMADALGKYEVVAGKLDHRRLNPGHSGGFGEVQTNGLMSGFDFLPWASGSCLGIRRSVFESVGGFGDDKDYCEDTDISWRLQLAGREIAFLPQALVFYRQRGSLRQMYRQHLNFGTARVLLYRDYRELGMSRRTLREAVREWINMTRSVPRLRTPEEKARWVRRLGRSLGFLRGSLKYRVFHP